MEGRVMRYLLEFCPNPNVVQVHTDIEGCVEDIERWESPVWMDEKTPRLVRDLFGIEGVVTVSCTRYQIQISKGGVFEWKEMISAILHTIHTNLDPNNELVEAQPPIQTHLDEQGFEHRAPLNQAQDDNDGE